MTLETVRRAITRPYPVTWPMILLVATVPFYLVIGERLRGTTVHVPMLALDRLLPLAPVWALIYGALYAFLIVLPVFVVQQPEMIRRTVWAYITVWWTAYVCFLVYPTMALRPETVPGDGFGAGGLRFLYGADLPYNCFPSIHVAHSFVSALACRRVNRALGLFTLSSAALVALATLLTKQHYVADVIGGIVLAVVANVFWLRGYARSRIPDIERRVAPWLAVCVAFIVAGGVACYWIAYKVGVF